MIDVCVSLVRYNQPHLDILTLFQTVKREALSSQFWVIDNSPEAISANDFSDTYIFLGKNIGFGAGHNIALRESPKFAKYHLLLNPDISFEPGVLDVLFRFMENNPDVGMVMPKVLYPDGKIQYLCNLVPSALDLIFRRFHLSRFFKARHRRYEMRGEDYDSPMLVPFLSGCFLVVRTSILSEVGFFDERYFMYMEDLDFSRRVAERYWTVYFPAVHVIHGYGQGSYKEPRLFWYHLRSAIKYFFKWGWFFDKKRRVLNSKFCCIQNKCNCDFSRPKSIRDISSLF